MKLIYKNLKPKALLICDGDYMFKDSIDNDIKYKDFIECDSIEMFNTLKDFDVNKVINQCFYVDSIDHIWHKNARYANLNDVINEYFNEIEDKSRIHKADICDVINHYSHERMYYNKIKHYIDLADNLLNTSIRLAIRDSLIVFGSYEQINCLLCSVCIEKIIDKDTVLFDGLNIDISHLDYDIKLVLNYELNELLK